ncbi:MAG: hypothetical protein ACTSPD_07320 [Promethearchaeota archaeon]
MSSTYLRNIKNNIRKNFSRVNFLNIKRNQNLKFKLISELVSILFMHKNSTDNFRNISKLINFLLNTDANYYYKCGNESYGDINKYLIVIKEIRSIMENNPNLSNKQRGEICIIERYFMKLYLKEFLLRL